MVQTLVVPASLLQGMVGRRITLCVCILWYSKYGSDTSKDIVIGQYYWVVDVVCLCTYSCELSLIPTLKIEFSCWQSSESQTKWSNCCNDLLGPSFIETNNAVGGVLITSTTTCNYLQVCILWSKISQVHIVIWPLPFQLSCFRFFSLFFLHLLHLWAAEILPARNWFGLS